MTQLLASLQHRIGILAGRQSDVVGAASYLAIGVAALWFSMVVYPLTPLGLAALVTSLVLGGLCVLTVVLAPVGAFLL